MKHQCRFIFSVLLLVLSSFILIRVTFGWVNPSGNYAAVGGGIIYSNSSGNIGIGNPATIGSKVSVSGGVFVGTGVDTGATSGNVNVVGKVGIGIASAVAANDLSVSDPMIGGVAIGANYANLSAPANSLIVEGKLGIGKSNPLVRLDVSGAFRSGNVLERGIKNSIVPVADQSIDWTSNDSRDSSMAIGLDGLPIFSYLTINGATTYAVKCLDLSCQTIDFANKVQLDTNTRIPFTGVGSDGYPIFIYAKVIAGTTHYIFAKCTSYNCLTTLPTLRDLITIPVVTSSQDDPKFIIGVDGQPIIVYEASGNTLNVIHCTSLALDCSSFAAPVAIAAAPAGQPFIAIGSDSLPIISYADGANLKVVKCNDIYCATSSVVTVEAGGNHNVMRIGTDGLPAIAHINATPQLNVVKCSTLSCSAVSSSIVLDSGNITTLDMSVPDDGLPMIAYNKVVNSPYQSDVWVAKCYTKDCARLVTTNLADGSNSHGTSITLVSGTDSLPLVLSDTLNSFGTIIGITAYHCGSENCVPFWTRR